MRWPWATILEQKMLRMEKMQREIACDLFRKGQFTPGDRIWRLAVQDAALRARVNYNELCRTDGYVGVYSAAKELRELLDVIEAGKNE